MTTTSATERPIHVSRFARTSALALVLAFAVAACGGDDDDASDVGDEAATTVGESPTSAPSGTTQAWPADRCGILSEEAASAAIGETVTAEEFEPFGCTYSSGAVIEYYSSNIECEGIEAREDDPEVVDGVGEHAVFGAGNTDEVLAVTLEDGRCFIVHGQYTGEGDSDTRIALARAVVAAV